MRTREPTRGLSGQLGGDSWHLVLKSLDRLLNETAVKEKTAGKQWVAWV